MRGIDFRSVLVQGQLSYAMRRAGAARGEAFGLQLLTAPQLAARLAGGLKRPASRESIEAGIAAALSAPHHLRDLGPVHDMPGMTRALVRTLRNIWLANFDLSAAPYADLPRIQDLRYVEDTIRANLQPGEHLLPDLVLLARDNLDTAPTMLGRLHLDRLHFLAPLWHDLINGLRDFIEVSWSAHPSAASGWFKGNLDLAPALTAGQRNISCADPTHEVLEAMRWARELVVSGRAQPSEIAITACTTASWDDYLLAQREASALPLTFVSGVPALTTWDGQRCAALADAFHNGLSQARVRRLLALSRVGTSLESLPDGPLPIPGEASLSTLDDWQRALADHPDVSSVLMPALEAIAGPDASPVKMADYLLAGRSRELWDDALRRAPASALIFTLETLRVPDERDPANAIAWCTADQLAAAPRSFVWLLGFTSVEWPRSTRLDPILPSYLVPISAIDPDPVEAADERIFRIISSSARELVCSSGRLNAQGTSASASAWIQHPDSVETRHRDHIPAHALTETDRLFARPQDAGEDPLLAIATAVTPAWNRRDLSARDGMVGLQHPLLSGLLARPQSPTSLSLLLRDPLSYVWYYALGWRDLVHKERSLTFASDDFGRLVHELLKKAVDHLEPAPGFTVAEPHEKEDALTLAAGEIIRDWPSHTDVPPPILWINTVRQARVMALAALTFETFTEQGTRSWTEVPFGGEVRSPVSPLELPWDSERHVVLPGTDVRIYGIIDRLDLRAGSVAVRVSDYKTGQRPKNPNEMFVAGGRELQRVLYALACRTLLPDTEQLSSRLIYLRPPVVRFPLGNAERPPDQVIAMLSTWVQLARTKLEAGTVYPGLAPYRDDPRFGRLGMPASSFYIERKTDAIRKAAGSDLAGYWRAP